MIDDGPPLIFGKDWHMGDRMVYRQFQCAYCGAQWTTTTTEAEANREYLASGQPASTTGISSVCDDCYEYLMARAQQDGLL